MKPVFLILPRVPKTKQKRPRGVLILYNEEIRLDLKLPESLNIMHKITDNILNLWTLLDFSGKKTNDWNHWTGLLQKFQNIFYSGQSFSACCIYFNLVHQSKNPSVCSMHTHLRRIGATIEDAVDLGPYKVHSDFSAFASCPEPFFLISLLTWAFISFISLVCRGGGLEPFTPL